LSELPLLSQLPALSGLPTLSELPLLSQLPALSGLPTLSELPLLSQLPALPGLAALSDPPVLSRLPALPPGATLPWSSTQPGLAQLPALHQSPVQPAFPHPVSLRLAAASPTLTAAFQPPALVGPLTAMDRRLFVGGTATVRSVSISRARAMLRPAPAQPLDPRPQPTDHSATTERTSESAGSSSPAMGTIPSSWLPEPLAGGRASAADATAPRGRALRYLGPPS
jgi:hypothetical protein